MSAYDWVTDILIVYTDDEKPSQMGDLTEKYFPKVTERWQSYGHGFDRSVEDGGFDEVKCRNECIAWAREFGNEFLIQCDSDEFYTPLLGEILDHMIRENIEKVVSLSCYHFISPSIHMIDVSSMRGIMHDPHIRVWRTTDEAWYHSLHHHKVNHTIDCSVNHDKGEEVFYEPKLCHVHVHDMIGHKASPDRHRLERFGEDYKVVDPSFMPQHYIDAFLSRLKKKDIQKRDLVKQYFSNYAHVYTNHNQMGDTIDHMMSYNEHKVVLTYLQHVLDNKVEGDIVEFGCFRGNTTVAMQRLLDLNNSDKKIYVYDSFEGLPDSDKKHDKRSNGECPQKGEMSCSLDDFTDNINNHHIKMPAVTKGFFKDIPKNNIPDKICFALSDGDLYQSTLDMLEKTHKNMSDGGIIVFDDFIHPSKLWVGCKPACDEFFKCRSTVKFIGDSYLLGKEEDFYYVSKETVSQGVYHND